MVLFVDSSKEGKWLLDPDVRTKRGILAKICNTFPNAWHQGEYDGKTVYVLGVQELGDSFSARARVRLSAPEYANTSVQVIPTEFLRPIHPENNDEHVLFLQGSHKGDEAVVRSVEGNMMVVTTKDSYVVVDTVPERLVRMADVDEEGNRL